MKFRFLWSILLISSLSCKKAAILIDVGNSEELHEALHNALPGSEIVMQNGDWNDIRIRFYGMGTKDKPITLRAEAAGKVFVQGESDLRLGGEYLIVEGLHFRNGSSPSRSLIEFALNSDTLANHSRVTNCVIKDFNKSQRNMTDLWIQFKGRHNQLDHCYIAGKSNRGPTVRVDLEGNQSIKNYHKITNNHFGPRPPKGGPSAETIQIGSSFTSMSPSYTMVAENLFERCNGEVEVISSKTNFNEFRNNVFYKSEGSLVTRHGNYCIVDGNYFIGDEESDHIGGVRLIGTGHWVTNNYFYRLKGNIFRSPLAVMNGIPKSPLNRYIQVTDVVVAFNSWIDCKSPLQFGVGSNISERDVLPASEIRSERPIRTLIANNIIYSSAGDEHPIVAHDQLDGITFISNAIGNQGVDFEAVEGIESRAFEVSEISENLFVPTTDLSDVDVHEGFEFDKINKDLLGNPRTSTNSIGAINGKPSTSPNIMDWSIYGPDWYSIASSGTHTQTHSATSAGDLATMIAAAEDGDTIELKGDTYDLNTSLKINKKITIRSADLAEIATIHYDGDHQTPAFEMNPKGELNLHGINLHGSGNQHAFASLEQNMSSLYNLAVTDCRISDFDFVLKAYKHSFAEYIEFTNTSILNCRNGLELSEERDDKGDYNAENISIDGCHFENIDRNVLDYYRGGYDESTIGGNLDVTNSTFTKCGAGEKSGILLNTYGIINVDISGNKFHQNKVGLIAQLWGAKNNTHSNNSILNSGKIVSEENLKLNLVY